MVDVQAFICFSFNMLCQQVSQTDYKDDGTVFGSLLNHVTDGRWATGALAVPPVCVLPKPA